jgi:hypothetical protein
MSAGIVSKYAGKCPICKQGYAEGDIVERVTPDSNQRGHLSCVRRTPDEPRRDKTPAEAQAEAVARRAAERPSNGHAPTNGRAPLALIKLIADALNAALEVLYAEIEEQEASS